MADAKFTIVNGPSRMDLMLALFEPVVTIGTEPRFRTVTIRVEPNDMERESFVLYVDEARRCLLRSDPHGPDVYQVKGYVDLRDGGPKLDIDNLKRADLSYNVRSRKGQLTIITRAF